MTWQVVNTRTAQRRVLRIIALLVSSSVLFLTGCSRDGGESPARGLPDSERPAILLITLDTTRADRLGIESSTVLTPNLSALADRGRYFTQAYSTTPTTLPSHTSMMTGTYPMQHGIRENGRRVGDQLELLAVKLTGLGYTTAAFVSGFPLAQQFGLARGFDKYDDTLADNSNERDATATTNAALDSSGFTTLTRMRRTNRRNRFVRNTPMISTRANWRISTAKWGDC